MSDPADKPIALTMPALSATMETGMLVRWLVAEGQSVQIGDLVAEIETDKATLDIEAEADGTVMRIAVPAGTRDVSVGTVLAYLQPLGIQTLPSDPKPVSAPRPSAPALTQRAALRDALVGAMRADDSVVVFGPGAGTDHSPNRISDGLADMFGTRRVVDTNAGPQALAGLGVGAALSGLRPVLDLECWALMLPALSLIGQAAAQARFASHGTTRCPLVLRGPHGAAAQSGPQLSMDVAALLTALPGLRVAAPFWPGDAAALLTDALRHDGPTALLESALLYGTQIPDPDDQDSLPAGKARLWRHGQDVTLVSYGIALSPVLDAAEHVQKDHGISADVIDLRYLDPLDIDTVAASVARTGRCITVEDGPPNGSIGARVAAAVSARVFDALRAPVAVVTGAETPLPYATALETAARPSAERIAHTIRAVVAR